MKVELENGLVLGSQIDLRLVREEDAEFILRLRQDGRLNRYVSAVDPDVESQRRWIGGYLIREGKKEEYYFIIRLKDGTPIGTVRLYDFRGASFSWGSWMIQGGSPIFASIESALLVYQLAYEHLGFERCHFEVRKENTAVNRFHRRWGARIAGEDDLNYYYESDKGVFYEAAAAYLGRISG